MAGGRRLAVAEREPLLLGALVQALDQAERDPVGRLGEKDGYATFDPTEFKVGDLDVPVSLVNPALQKKLAEQRDRLKLPMKVIHLAQILNGGRYDSSR